jgi:crotonobetaine/carnitine-CoA ligase
LETVFDAFMASAEAAPDNAFLCVPAMAERDYHPEGAEFSYAATRQTVLALESQYAAAGYGHGHRVALLLENRPEFLFHYLALNALGVSIVPVNPDYRHEEMLYQMDHSEADLAVSIASRTHDLERVAGDREKPLPVVDAEAWPEALPRPGPPPHNTPPGSESECALLYTSGTTGRPKGCILSNFYYLNAGRWYTEIGGVTSVEPGRERLINPLPLSHMNNLAICATAMMLTAGCLIVPDRFHPKSWWRDVVATRATIMHYLGVMPPLLLNMPETPEERRHTLRFAFGAGIEPELHQVFEERFGFPLIEGWGMTETGRIYADADEPRQVDTRAMGRPRDGLEAMVVDDDDHPVAVGDEGELLVRFAGEDPRKGFFSGYLKNEEATAEAWKGGWFHTGDVVRQAGDGMIYFVDRKKNIIRRSGENIAAAEIEAVLQANDRVAQVAVIAVPDKLREEEVMACVVPMAGVEAGEAAARALVEWCGERLAYFKVPGWVLFVDSLPTTGTQKVQKTELFPAGEDPRRRPGAVDLRALKKRKRD